MFMTNTYLIASSGALTVQFEQDWSSFDEYKEVAFAYWTVVKLFQLSYFMRLDAALFKNKFETTHTVYKHLDVMFMYTIATVHVFLYNQIIDLEFRAFCSENA